VRSEEPSDCWWPSSPSIPWRFNAVSRMVGPRILVGFGVGSAQVPPRGVAMASSVAWSAVHLAVSSIKL